MDNNCTYVHITCPENVQVNLITSLSAEERTRANNFVFAEDRKLYIAAHIFLRQQLSQYASLAPEDWRFVTNQHGKPFINNPRYKWLQFNLSHTPGLIACAISAVEAVGIDVEQQKTLSDLESLCRYAFSTVESSAILTSKHTKQKEERFFTYWTLKEAYIKAIGMGLSLPLQDFSFSTDIKANWHINNTRIHHTAQTKNWRFDHQNLTGFHLSVATPLSGSFIYHDEHHGNPNKHYSHNTFPKS